MKFLPETLLEGMPRLIQAGMGVHISSAHLANTTSRLGALGVVSGAALRHVLVEDVRRGDAQAIELARTFPLPQYVEDVLAYAPGGRKHQQPVPVDVPDLLQGALAKRLATIGAYVEVKRARQGHQGKVGINVMWKCSLTVLPTIYGAMLAGVDALICGAGVPMELPDIVRCIREGHDLHYAQLTGTGTHVSMKIAQDHPQDLLAGQPEPHLMPILSNYAFSRRMLDVWEKNYQARPFAFILENHQAGGHNAPPRNKATFTADDDLATYFPKVLQLGVPIYVAGDFREGGSRHDFEEWLERGAYGIQVGSRFALSADSGMREDLREQIVAGNASGELKVETSNVMSPTGYPIKFVALEKSVADPEVYAERPRVCNRGYLTQSHFETLPDGTIRETYVCPAMPDWQYMRLGGSPEELADRVCLCNALLSTAGFYDDMEPPLVTLGVSGQMVKEHYTARQVMEDILGTEYVASAEAALSLGAPGSSTADTSG